MFTRVLATDIFFSDLQCVVVVVFLYIIIMCQVVVGGGAGGDGGDVFMCVGEGGMCVGWVGNTIPG